MPASEEAEVVPWPPWPPLLLFTIVSLWLPLLAEEPRIISLVEVPLATVFVLEVPGSRPSMTSSFLSLSKFESEAVVLLFLAP